MSIDLKNLTRRPPIVVVMGHIDHGKTTLLDTIRKSNVAGQESGGITQHIGAYEVEHDGKRITFLDTPGHEAFTQMRSRGATVADVAILIVAADDGVKPQTREALSAILTAKIPYCVAINKVDKPTSDVERVKNDLAQEEVYLEGRGGTVPVVEISAKQNTGIEQLLETVLILSELEDLSSNPREFAKGVVIESHRDQKRGITSTLLITDGTLKKNEYIAAGLALAKSRLMEDYTGKAVDQAGPSSPVVIVGFDTLPAVGSAIQAFFSQKEAMAFQHTLKESARIDQVAARQKNFLLPTAEGAKDVIIALIIKGDTEGSCEAIAHEVAKIKGEGFTIKILRSQAGDVSLDDVGLAASGKHSAVIAFKVGVSADAKELSEKQSVIIGSCDIIYEIPTFLKDMLEGLLPPVVERKEVGRAKVLKIFKADQKTQVIGGRVVEGVVRKAARFGLVRRDTVIGEGDVENLQSGKMNASEVAEKHEFGALVRSTVSVATDDTLVLFEESITKRTL